MRTEIKESIRSEIHPILRELFREEFSVLKDQLSSFEDSIKFINSQYEDMKNSINSFGNDIQHLREENSILQSKMKDMETRISQFEQDARQTNIEIHCLPEHR